jgi:hypothetical protein
LGVACDTNRYMPIQMDIYTYIQIQIHTGQHIKRHTEYRHIWHIYIIQANTCTVVSAYMSFFWKKNIFHQIQANISKYRHILAYTSKYNLQYLLVFMSYIESVCVCMCDIFTHMLVFCLYFLQPKPLVVLYKQNTSI